MEDSARGGFTNATDMADYLVGKGVPFRDAHGIIGALVLMAQERNCALDDLSLEDMKSVSPAFEEDVYEALSMKACIERRNTTGAPGPKAMEEEIRAAEEILKQ